MCRNVVSSLLLIATVSACQASGSRAEDSAFERAEASAQAGHLEQAQVTREGPRDRVLPIESAASATVTKPRAGLLALFTLSAAVVGTVTTVAQGTCRSSDCLAVGIVEKTAELNAEASAALAHAPGPEPRAGRP
ncbi:MAG: hypothetical protein JWN48_3599 [Myxococcaceae bacterium]|nr:hypothetical protein [Myxococcaceae bacterium]